MSIYSNAGSGVTHEIVVGNYWQMPDDGTLTVLDGGAAADVQTAALEVRAPNASAAVLSREATNTANVIAVVMTGAETSLLRTGHLLIVSYVDSSGEAHEVTRDAVVALKHGVNL